MRKQIITLISFILIIGMMCTCFNSCDTNQSSNDGAQNSLQNYSDRVLEINDSDLMNIRDITSINDFLCSSGVLIVNHNYYTSIATSSKLQFPISMTNDEDNNIVDLATIYYIYGSNNYGVFVVSASKNQLIDKEPLVAEAVETALYRQSLYQAVTVSENYTADSLGFVDIIVASEPKGKIRASYEVFTVQDYHDLDFYIIKANITGLPGCVLFSENANYKKAFQIENMSAVISTSTTSVTLDAYGPHTTSSDSSSYSVDIGMSVDSEGSIAISGGWSYSREITNAGIEGYCTSKKASWDVALKGDAQKSSFVFEPTASFKCPYNKASVEISVESSCVFDSWYSLNETVSLKRTIICTQTSLENN